MKQIEIKGKNPSGKNILIITGIHGNELTPIHTGWIINDILKTESLKTLSFDNFNKVTILNGVNDLSIEEGTREFPDNSTNDLNRAFFINELVDIKTIIEDEIEEHDIIIDIHSSPRCTNFALINYNEFAEKYISLCEAANMDYLVRANDADTVKNYSISRGKIAFTLETNSLDTIEHELSYVLANKVINLLKIVVETTEIDPIEPRYDILYKPVYSLCKGIIIWLHKPGSALNENEVIARVLDYEGKLVGNIKSPCKGKLIAVTDRDFCKKSEEIALIQPILK